MEEAISLEEAEENKGYIIVASDGGEGPHFEVRGILRSKKVSLEGIRCWRLESTTMHHVIPIEFIIEVRKEQRRYVW